MTTKSGGAGWRWGELWEDGTWVDNTDVDEISRTPLIDTIKVRRLRSEHGVDPEVATEIYRTFRPGQR